MCLLARALVSNCRRVPLKTKIYVDTFSGMFSSSPCRHAPPPEGLFDTRSRTLDCYGLVDKVSNPIAVDSIVATFLVPFLRLREEIDDANTKHFPSFPYHLIASHFFLLDRKLVFCFLILVVHLSVFVFTWGKITLRFPFAGKV